MNPSCFIQALLHAWACLLHSQRKSTNSTKLFLILQLRCPVYRHAAACRSAAAAQAMVAMMTYRTKYLPDVNQHHGLLFGALMVLATVCWTTSITDAELRCAFASPASLGFLHISS
jgi:hypothetical protein